MAATGKECRFWLKQKTNALQIKCIRLWLWL